MIKNKILYTSNIIKIIISNIKNLKKNLYIQYKVSPKSIYKTITIKVEYILYHKFSLKLTLHKNTYTTVVL